MSDRYPDFAPTARWQTLHRRANLLAQVRQFFFDHSFLEVETPLLSHDTVVDLHLDPLAVPIGADASKENRPAALMWLQTSPEFGMKRLLAAGAPAIYQVTRAFRAGEHGPLHNPEFTIAEWYRVGDSMDAAIGLLDALIQKILDRGTAQRMTYGESFQRWIGLDPHECPTSQLAEAAHDHGLQKQQPWDPDDRDAWLDWLLVSCIEPNLGLEQPTILSDYPASQAALAQLRPDNPALAERFELYVDGIELANGYHELTDANELIRRNQRANEQRIARGKRPLPEASRMLDAMHHGLPACSGVALGFDRLVMVATGADNLAQIMTFPADRA